VALALVVQRGGPCGKLLLILGVRKRPRCEHPRSGVIAADLDAHVQALAALCGTPDPRVPHARRRCEDPRNGVIIADFAVQGTLARQLLDSPSHVITRAGAKARTGAVHARAVSAARGAPRTAGMDRHGRCQINTQGRAPYCTAFGA